MFVKVNNQEEYDLVIAKMEKETGLKREHFIYYENYPIIGKNEFNTAICGWVEDCQDVEGYISAEQYLSNKTIELRCEIWNTTLIVQTLHCEPFESVSKNGIELTCNDSTLLSSNRDIYLGLSEGTCNTDTYHFNTQAEAQAYLDTLLELVEMVNNPVPVVDLNKTKSINLDKYILYVNPDMIELTDENDNTLYECRKIVSIPIIKQQLEQILEQLNVKADVRI